MSIPIHKHYECWDFLFSETINAEELIYFRRKNIVKQRRPNNISEKMK